MQNLVEALANDEEFTDTSDLLIETTGSLSDEDDLAELEGIQNAAEEEPTKMDSSIIDSLIEEVEKLCGPRPDLDLRK